MVEQLPLTVDSMNKMKSTQLSEDQARDLAKRSLTTRFDEDEIDALNIWTTPIGSGLYYVPKGLTSQGEWLMQDFLN